MTEREKVHFINYLSRIYGLDLTFGFRCKSEHNSVVYRCVWSRRVKLQRDSYERKSKYSTHGQWHWCTNTRLSLRNLCHVRKPFIMSSNSSFSKWGEVILSQSTGMNTGSSAWIQNFLSANARMNKNNRFIMLRPLSFHLNEQFFFH